VVLVVTVVFVLAENLPPTIGRMIFAEQNFYCRMEEKINPVSDKESILSQGKHSGSERTKRFLKKLEIQHKVLQRLIGDDQSGKNPEPGSVKEKATGNTEDQQS
jgi:hypothetical protein